MTHRKGGEPISQKPEPEAQQKSATRAATTSTITQRPKAGVPCLLFTPTSVMIMPSLITLDDDPGPARSAPLLHPKEQRRRSSSTTLALLNGTQRQPRGRYKQSRELFGCGSCCCCCLARHQFLASFDGLMLVELAPDDDGRVMKERPTKNGRIEGP